MIRKIKLSPSFECAVDFDESALAAVSASLADGAKVGVACSGGADSVFLLFCVAAIFRKHSASLRVLHFNHKLRANAELDEGFVRALCERLGLEFFGGAAESAPEKRSEAAFREMRMDFFLRARKELHLDIIAQGHHAGDVSESVLMRLMRGSGTEGLAAPRAVSEFRGARFARPLLKISKAEIVENLKAAKIEWREDESNADCDWLRNKVRNILLPEIKKIAPIDFESAAGRSRMLLAEDADCLDEILAEELLSVSANAEAGEDAVYLSENAVRRRALLRRAAMLLLERNGLLENIRGEAVDAFLDKAAAAKSSFKTSVGQKFLRWEPRESRLAVDVSGDFEEFEIPLKIGRNPLPCGGEISVKRIHINEARREAIKGGGNDDSVSAYLDLKAAGDLCQGDLCARTRRDGDAYAPIGSKSSRRLKELLSSKKVPLMKRKAAVLVCNKKGEILWSPALPPNAKYALANSGVAIELTYTPA